MKYIKSIYSNRHDVTTFKCSKCKKAWELKGKEFDLKVSERLFLLNHDRSHNK